MRAFILMALTFSFILLYAQPSYAQTPPLSQETPENDVPPSSQKNIFDDATDEQIKEAQQFYNYCTDNDTISAKKDCKCATVSYLNARLKLGPDVTTKQIMAHNVNTCLKDAARSKIDKTRATRDLSHITDTQLAEAEEVFQHCKARRALSSQFDCECFAARFLDERLDIGPIANWDIIFIRFQSECRNVVETTGYAYSRCMSNFGVRSAINMEPKEFCECYARKWADIFENFPGKISTDSKRMMRSQARGHCRDIGRARGR